MEKKVNEFKGCKKEDFFATIAPLRAQYHKLKDEGKFQGRFNDYLRAVYSDLEGTEEFNSFNGWKKKGYKVKKGEKSYRVFSAPKQIQTKVGMKDAETGDKKEVSFTNDRYFQACIFSKNQVEKIEQ